MRLPKAKDRGSLEFNMTPMIDVTFLLIIFFLLSSHLAQQEIQAELDLPAAASGKPSKEDDATRRITVNVLADGRMLLGSQEVGADELTRRIEFEGRQHQSKGQELEVRIRCARQAPYHFVEPIMLACARNGVSKVTFAVVHKEA